MKLGLINSAWVQANQPTVFGLRKTKEIGFDSVDIFVDPLEIDVCERRKRYRDYTRRDLGALPRTEDIGDARPRRHVVPGRCVLEA